MTADVVVILQLVLILVHNLVTIIRSSHQCVNFGCKAQISSSQLSFKFSLGLSLGRLFLGGLGKT